MKLHGTLQANLEAAILAANRRRGTAVYPDTLAHWQAILFHARREIAEKGGPHAATLSRLAHELELAVKNHVAR